MCLTRRRCTLEDMDIFQLALALATVLGVLVVALVAIVPNAMELPGHL